MGEMIPDVVGDVPPSNGSGDASHLLICLPKS